MMKSVVRHIVLKGRLLAASLLAATGVLSCDSVIYDYEGDCSVHYRVGFRYTRNLLGSDAFGPQVTKVSLYLFDEDGRLAFSRSVQREAGAENDFYIDVDVDPGRYDLLAWCEGESVMGDDAVSYIVADAVSPSSAEDLSAELPLAGEAPGLFSDKDIRRFFHGFERDIEFPDSYGTIDAGPVMLTKNTNHITLRLVNLDGEILPEDFSVELEGKCRGLDHLNNPTGDVPFLYKPWAVKGFTADNAETREAASAGANGIQFELTAGRIMADTEQVLSVRRSDGETVLRIPLVQYLLLVRDRYSDMKSDQDYLDCYDDFSMVFFMQEGHTWMNSRVIINGWRVVPPQSDII